MTGSRRGLHGLRVAFFGVSALALAACDDGFQLPFGEMQTASASTADRPAPTEMSGQEVEAPDVFLAEETGIWDGRPSLGGVWVAHPDVTDPERVLVTNHNNGETIAAALFRRERDNPGPSIQLSSDAAMALNVIAGQPTELTVVALRRQEVPAELDLPPPPEATAEATVDADADADAESALPAAIAAATLEPSEEVETIDVAAIAESAIAVSASPAPAPVATLSASTIAEDLAAAPASAPAPAAEPVAAPVATSAAPQARPEQIAAIAPEAPAAPAPREDLERAYLQVGIFSDEANAEGVASALRSGGVVPTVLDQSDDERSMWRVVVGPARTAAERAVLLETIQGLGYEDAYPVTN